MSAARFPQQHGRTIISALTICIWVVGSLLVSGCGRATYERRLRRTVELAEYRAKLDENLNSNWKQKGVQIRVPKQFVKLRPPEPPKKKENETSADETILDPRQPDFLSVPLPGLIGAWKAEVDLADGAGTAPAYLYVLSNYEMWTKAGQGEEALEFNKSIAPHAVVDGLRAKLPEPAEWVSESHPRRDGFVASKRLIAAIVTSTVRLTLTPETKPEDGKKDDTNERHLPPSARPRVVDLPVNCKMYLAENKDLHVMLLLILPEQIDSREKLSLDTSSKSSSRVAMCLETLTVSNKKPSIERSGDGASTGGGRAGF